MARTRRTKGAGSVFQDAKGTWHFKRYLGTDPMTGKRRVIEVRGKSKAETRARYEAKLADYERTGLLPNHHSPTTADYAERWLADYRTRVKPNTYNTRAGRIHACCQLIGGIRLNELTAEHIRLCMRALAERLAPSTLKDHYVSLKMLLDQAETDELIHTNPMRKVKPPRVEPIHTAILEPDQPRRLLEAIPTSMGTNRHGPTDTTDDKEMWALLFEIAFTTGLRPGERRALMPFQLETRNGIHGVNICQQIQRYGDPSHAVIPKWLDATHLWGGLWLTTPKTAAGRRFVPLPDGLWQRLHNRIIRMHIDDHDLIFRTHLGRPVNDSNERRHFKTALAAAGLPDVKLYSARHWTATMTALADMPDDARIAIMGHTDPAMTRRYTHRPESSLAALLAQAIPDLGADMVEAEIIDETTK